MAPTSIPEAVVPNAPVLDNLTSNETIYQRFVLVTGTAGLAKSQQDVNSYVSVETTSFPVQTFPCSPTTGAFKALVHLQPGPQTIKFSYRGDDAASTTVTNIMYLPLLHIPPLFLAIMVASDSPQFMDCPPEKCASSSHNDVSAAVKKMRTWAYMCQAYTAEEMRKNGFGRRSFRLEEEWGQDTLSIYDDKPTFRMTAKVHIVKSKMTTEQLRNPDLAQQNSAARNKDRIYNIFHDALQDYGGPFEAFGSDPNGPVVAGLIFDSHYDPKQDLILAHAALGGTGGSFSKVHLGMFGSHTHWAWPRFVEEISLCLLDPTRVTARSRVGNDNGQCGSFWETCCIGQGASLHEVGHALGLPHQTTGIMNRGYVEWNRSFVAKESYSVRLNKPGSDSVPNTTSNHWHLADLLHFSTHHMFAIPYDAPRKPRAPILIRSRLEQIDISSDAGIALLEWQVAGETTIQNDLRAQKTSSVELRLKELQAKLTGIGGDGTTGKKLTLTVTATDGAQRTVNDFWDYAFSSHIMIPDSDIWIRKKSVIANEGTNNQRMWKWAVLLTRLGDEGKLIRATRIEIRVGAWFDGCYVQYEDGTREMMGAKTYSNGERKDLGGNTYNLSLNPNEKLTHLLVQGSGGYGSISGVSMFTTEKSAGKVYNASGAEELRPDDGEEIVGFYGKNVQDNGFCPNIEIGILTVPVGVTLPKQAYELPSLRNTDGGSDILQGPQIATDDCNDNDDDDDDERVSEDEDEDECESDKNENDENAPFMITSDVGHDSDDYVIT